MRSSTAVVMLALFCAAPALAAPVEEQDRDNNGTRETKLYYDDAGRLSKMTIDKNDDGKPDVTIFYKAGVSDHGERDVDFDGKIDTWMKYDGTGTPTEVSMDRKRKDGKPDYWVYLQKGKVVREEWDRNFDGKPDYRQIRDGKLLIEKQYDENHDGKFERIVKPPARGSTTYANAFPYDDAGNVAPKK